MSKISKGLHMFVADQWVQGNAETPKAYAAGCSDWFPNGVTEVCVGNQFRQFQGVQPSEVMQWLKGAGWYGSHAKVAQRVLQGAKFERVEVRFAVSYTNRVFIKGGGAVDFLKYQKGNSPALFLLAAYRKHKKIAEANRIKQFNENVKRAAEAHGDGMDVVNAIRTGTPLRGHTSRMHGPDINVQTLPKPQKLNTLLLHSDLANALEAVNRVLHWGCNERQPPYQETGWKDVPLDKYKQALLRHQSEWLKDPSSLDDESGKLHLAHMATNALILLQRWPEEGKNGSSDH